MNEALTRAALEALARNVIAERNRRGWSQTDLAAATGLSQQRISQLEAVKSGATIETVAKVAHGLGTTVGALLSD